MGFRRRGKGRLAAGRYLAPSPDDEDFPPMGIVRRLVRESGLALVTAGLIVLLFVGYQLLGTNLTEQHNQSRLQKQFDQTVAAHAATAPSTTTAPTTTTAAGSAPTPSTTATPANQAATGGSDNPTVGGVVTQVPTGAAIDHLVIPAIGVDKYVVEGVSQSDLTAGPGHYPQTALPGQVGNAAIAGHRTTYGAPFFRLDSLKSGDDIYVTDTSDHRFTYRVQKIKVVAPNDTSVLEPTRTAQLTLTTCNPRFAETSRLIVVAALSVPKSLPAAKGATTTTTVPPAVPAQASRLAAVNLGQGDAAARTPALVYGALVVLLWVLTRVAVHRTRRWKRNLAYVVGIVACLVALWFCFENVVRLLPPNI